MRKTIYLFICLALALLTGCEDRLPSVEGAPDYTPEVCVTFLSQGLVVQEIDIGEAPGHKTGQVAFVRGCGSGVALACYDYNFTTQTRESEAICRLPNVGEVRYSLDVEGWSGLIVHLRVYLRQKMETVWLTLSLLP